MGISNTLYDRLGGKPTLQRVHKVFYDKAFAHPWLGQYFQGRSQQLLEDQQTDFLTSIIGGPKLYMGRAPKFAHQHMVITEELFDLRQRLLGESISECGVNDDLKDEWLAADNALRRAIVKKDASECTLQYNDEILDFKKPH